MKKRTIRTIIHSIYTYIFLNVSFEFMLNDYIEKWLEMVIFAIMFLFFNWFSFYNGLKTCKEIHKEVEKELEARNEKLNSKEKIYD